MPDLGKRVQRMEEQMKAVNQGVVGQVLDLGDAVI